MAFKMNRPLKMAGPKKSVLNLGRAKTEDSGLYYNSSMGPMKMHSPSALKQMEEEGAGMEEMMGMAGEMGGGAPTEGPIEEAPVEKEGGEEEFQGGPVKEPKPEDYPGVQAVSEVKQDENGLYILTDDARYNLPDGFSDYKGEVPVGEYIDETALEEFFGHDQSGPETEMQE
jgi:hypothetical protein